MRKAVLIREAGSGSWKVFGEGGTWYLALPNTRVPLRGVRPYGFPTGVLIFWTRMYVLPSL